MRNSRMSPVILVGLLLFVGSFVRVPVMHAWMRYTGGLEPSGLATYSMSQKPAAVLSLLGREPGPADVMRTNVAAYHVLVLFPGSDSLTAVNWSQDVDNADTDLRQAWLVWSGGRAIRREFSSRYNGLARVAVLDGQRYPLKHGNLFVVRYDERGEMSVRQLPRIVRESPVEAMDAFEVLLAGDALVRDLRHYDYPAEKPCPHRQAPPARGASA